MKNLMREPLVCFLVLGAGLFVVHHLVSALHAYGALLLLVMGVVLFVQLPLELIKDQRARSLMNSAAFDLEFGLGATAVFAWYLYSSLRRAYGDSRVFAGLATPILAVGVVLILFSYRTVLFLTTFWAT